MRGLIATAAVLLAPLVAAWFVGDAIGRLLMLGGLP